MCLIFEFNGGKSYLAYNRKQVIIAPDSSSEEDYILGVAITSEIDTEESVDRLEQFDDDWWLEASKRSHNKLLIDLE